MVFKEGTPVGNHRCMEPKEYAHNPEANNISNIFKKSCYSENLFSDNFFFQVADSLLSDRALVERIA